MKQSEKLDSPHLCLTAAHPQFASMVGGVASNAVTSLLMLDRPWGLLAMSDYALFVVFVLPVASLAFDFGHYLSSLILDVMSSGSQLKQSGVGVNSATRNGSSTGPAFMSGTKALASRGPPPGPIANASRNAAKRPAPSNGLGSLVA